jgi:CheY-like chemotaxis protein
VCGLGGQEAGRKGRVEPVIFIVDDDPLITRALGRVLRHEVVKSAHSPAEAVELLESHAQEVVLILCDLSMPPWSGRDLQSDVGSRWPWLLERMVFMTGGATTQDDRDFLESLGDQVLHKPIDIPRLQRLVRLHQSAFGMD